MLQEKEDRAAYYAWKDGVPVNILGLRSALRHASAVQATADVQQLEATIAQKAATKT